MTTTAKTLAPEEQGIGIRAAVQAARKYMKEAHDGPLEDVQLEETELTGDERQWIITLSYLRVEPPNNSMFASAMSSIQSNKVRIYKTVTVDARTGKARSMKIRKV
jgi:hypothetical protein